MTLTALIRGRRTEKVATATPATLATVTAANSRSVATVATVAVAKSTQAVLLAEPTPRKLGDSERGLLEEWAGDDQDALRYYLAEAERDPELVVNVARDLAAAALSAEPWLRCAVRVIDPDADPVRVVVAYRGVGTAVLEIPGGRWDPWLFLRVLQQQGTAS
jgi:hypothetical protein